MFNGVKINGLGVLVNQVTKKLSTLSIDTVSAEQAGEYTCKAENLAGFATYSAHLYIHGIKPISINLLILLFPPFLIPSFC
jgi:hypothetical protein